MTSFGVVCAVTILKVEIDWWIDAWSNGMTSHNDHSTRNLPFGKLVTARVRSPATIATAAMEALSEHRKAHDLDYGLHRCLERYRYNLVMDQSAADGFYASMPNTSCVLDSSQAHSV